MFSARTSGKLRPTIPLCKEKGTSPSVTINSWLIYWMVKVTHLTLDFPLSYLQIQGVLKGHCCLTGLLQWGSHLTDDGQRRQWKRHNKRSVPGIYLLLTRPSRGLSSKLHLHLPDLCTSQNYWWHASFAIDLLMISSCSKQQEQMLGGTKFSLDIYGPWPASTRTCPQGIKMCRGGQLVKTEKLPGELLLPLQVGFFLPCFCN